VVVTVNFAPFLRYIGRKAPLQTYPTSIWRPIGVMPLEFRRDFWRRKTRIPGLSYSVVNVILGLAVFVQL